MMLDKEVKGAIILYIVLLCILLLTVPSYIVYGMTYPEHLLGIEEVRQCIEDNLHDDFVIVKISHLHREYNNWVSVYVETCIENKPYYWNNEYVWYNFDTGKIKMGDLNNRFSY